MGQFAPEAMGQFRWIVQYRYELLSSNRLQH